MKTILIPTDFSENASIAVRYAANLAQATQQRLKLFHSYIPLYTGYDGNKNAEKVIEQKNTEAITKMEQLVQSFHLEFPNIDISGDCIGGYATETILDKINTENYSLVIMGTKGVSNTAEKILGSVTYEIIVNSSIPILAVPQEYKEFNLEHIAFFSAYQDAEVSALLRMHHTINHHYSTDIIHLYPSSEQEPLEQAQRWENKLNDEFPNEKFTFKTIRVPNIDSAAVASIADNDKFDLLVFTRPHKSFFPKIFKKSLTKDVAVHLKTPSLFINV